MCLKREKVLISFDLTILILKIYSKKTILRVYRVFCSKMLMNKLFCGGKKETSK
jgi:hypothetical protein